MKIDDEGFIFLGDRLIGMTHSDGFTEYWTTKDGDVGFIGSIQELLKALVEDI